MVVLQRPLVGRRFLQQVDDRVDQRRRQRIFDQIAWRIDQATHDRIRGTERIGQSLFHRALGRVDTAGDLSRSVVGERARRDLGSCPFPVEPAPIAGEHRKPQEAFLDAYLDAAAATPEVDLQTMLQTALKILDRLTGIGLFETAHIRQDLGQSFGDRLTSWRGQRPAVVTRHLGDIRNSIVGERA